MVSGVSGDWISQLGSPNLFRKTTQGAEVFSVALDKELLTLLVDEMQKLGLDPDRIRITPQGERRIPDAKADGRQISAGPGTAPAPAEPPPAGSKPAQPAVVQNPAVEAPFVPAFQTDVEVKCVLGGSWLLNPAYFATRETAAWIAKKYGTGEVVEVPFGGEGGPFYATAKELHIRLPGGRTVNAGVLADYYRRMPETQFPGLADQYARAVVAATERQL